MVLSNLNRTRFRLFQSLPWWDHQISLIFPTNRIAIHPCYFYTINFQTIPTNLDRTELRKFKIQKFDIISHASLFLSFSVFVSIRRHYTRNKIPLCLLLVWSLLHYLSAISGRLLIWLEKLVQCPVRKEEEWWLVWSKYLLHKIAQIKLPAALCCKEKYKLQLPAKTGEMVSALTTLQPLPWWN